MISEAQVPLPRDCAARRPATLCRCVAQAAASKASNHRQKAPHRFIALIDKYESFDSLTIAMLNEFIEKILVLERDRKGSRETTQEVEICFNFVGRFVPPQERGTQGQTTSELLEAQSQRKTSSLRKQNQEQA